MPKNLGKISGKCGPRSDDEPNFGLTELVLITFATKPKGRRT
jgi:hypothetical protein